MKLGPKAQSVTEAGMPDGFIPPLAYHPQILDGGYTRLEISAPSERLKIVHQSLIKAIKGPYKVRYVQMTSRANGQLPKPKSFVGVEITQTRLMQAIDAFGPLLYHDGRCQFWILGALNEQLVIDEIGMMYLYPDDPSFQHILNQLGWHNMPHQSMASRDYVRVNFLSEADALEASLIQSLGLVEWDG